MGNSQCMQCYKKKAINGLDEFLANGRDAFDAIKTMLEKMQGINQEDQQFVYMATKRLQQSRQYLETDYKLHVKSVSRVPDHCIRWALSDPIDKKFATSCEEGEDAHKHDMTCDRCEQLKAILGEIRTHIFAYEMAENEKARFRSKFLASEKAIMEMRRHQLRSVLSSNVRQQFVEHLRTNEAFVTLDWAMKLFPQKYRERQSDFYGKKGLSWHITHALSRACGTGNRDDELCQRTFVHFFEQDLQDSDAVLAILRHVLTELKKHNIVKVVLRSDNAGCYHSSKTMASIIKISEETGVAITHYSFSEPQAGKSSCDRMAAVVKRKLNDYIDQGHDITNGFQFMLAMKSAVELNGLAFYWASVEQAKENAKPAIPQVSQHNEWAFGSGVHARKFWGIGDGISIDERYWQEKESSAYLKIHDTVKSDDTQWSYIHCARPISDSSTSNFEKCSLPVPEEVQQIYDESLPDNDEGIYSNELPQTYFDCPEPNCIAQFLKLGNLYRHMIQGNHKFKEERLTMRDYALNGFIDNIGGGQRRRHFKKQLKNLQKISSQ